MIAILSVIFFAVNAGAVAINILRDGGGEEDAGEDDEESEEDGDEAGLEIVPVTEPRKQWWPRISNVAPDWGVKGAHVHVGPVELAARPAADGGIVWRRVGPAAPEVQVRAAIRTATRALQDVGFRQRLYNSGVRAIELLGRGTPFERGRMAEVRFLLAALERLGLS